MQKPELFQANIRKAQVWLGWVGEGGMGAFAECRMFALMAYPLLYVRYPLNSPARLLALARLFLAASPSVLGCPLTTSEGGANKKRTKGSSGMFVGELRRGEKHQEGVRICKSKPRESAKPPLYCCQHVVSRRTQLD